MTYPQVKSNFLFSVSLKGYELKLNLTMNIYIIIYMVPLKKIIHTYKKTPPIALYSFPGILIIIEMNVKAKFIQPFLQGLYL